MKHIDRINISAKNTSLVKDFGMPDYSPLEYKCPKHGCRLKLMKKRVLYCKPHNHGYLHPRYNFALDAII